MPASRFPVSNPVPSFWTTPAHPLDDFRSSPNLPSACDVLIVGSGYAGVATAHHLLKTPRQKPDSVVLLEARQICSGASGRNGGHVKPDTYFNVPKYAKLYGPKQAAALAKFESSQVHAVKELVEAENLDCDFHLTRAVDVYLDEKTAKDTTDSYRRLVREGVVDMKDVAYTPRTDAERISGVKGAKCCFSFTAAHLWPKKMIQGLLERLIKKGLQVHANTPVTEVSPTRDSQGYWTVQTPRGAIKTRKIVFCANGYTSAILPQYADKIVPVRGLCSHITTPKGSLAPHLVNTYSLRFDGPMYDYLIPRADGSIVVGGARQKFWHRKDSWFDNVNDDELIGEANDYFDGYMQRHFRGWEDSGAKTERVWTGIMGYSSDFMPHIGKVPDAPGQFILAGFSGHGMPMILLASKEVAAMVADDVPYEQTELPLVFKTTSERLQSEKNEMLDGFQKLWSEEESLKAKL